MKDLSPKGCKIPTGKLYVNITGAHTISLAISCLGRQASRHRLMRETDLRITQTRHTIYKMYSITINSNVIVSNLELKLNT
jgi:hypothetical protein